jgi:hypothetical protein
VLGREGLEVLLVSKVELRSSLKEAHELVLVGNHVLFQKLNLVFGQLNLWGSSFLHNLALTLFLLLFLSFFLRFQRVQELLDSFGILLDYFNEDLEMKVRESFLGGHELYERAQSLETLVFQGCGMLEKGLPAISLVDLQ